jgi:two-component system alkaline phosphatase synthesis response regulator PhoP
VARDGEEALDVLRASGPDLVLLDVMMPRKTGFEVCQELRADEAMDTAACPDADGQGPRHRRGQGPGRGRRRLHDQALSTKELVAKVREMLGAAA